MIDSINKKYTPKKYYALQDDNDDYVKFLQFLRKNKDLLKSEMGPYRDPDDRKNEDFYNDLCTFLNHQEEDCEGELNEKYFYEFASGEGVVVRENDKNGKILVHLISDQFRFSAPRIRLNHIYDVYLTSEKFDGDYEVIKNWIKNSRTLGGSFLWPKNDIEKKYDRQYDYNYLRGGAITWSSNIQDRVDLTLLELKNYYVKDYENCPLLYKTANALTSMRTWLNHFKNFDAYVDFFKFENFVENGEPKRLVGLEKENGKEKHIYKDDFDIRAMLEDLCGDNGRIIKRTQKMENPNK